MVGFSQTAGWYETPEFLTGVDASAFQLRWESGGDILQWSTNAPGTTPGVYWDRPIGEAHDGHGAHVCATGSTAPDRVIFTPTRAAYIDATSNFWTVGYLEGVYRNAKAKYPNALVFFQPIVAGPALNRCDWPISDQLQTQPYVRATWNAPAIDAAITYELAQRQDVGVALTPEVQQCTDYTDWGGHLTAAGYAAAGQRIASGYRARFGLPVPTPAPTATPQPTATATTTPTPTATSSPTPTPTGTPAAAGTTVTFDDLAAPNRALAGQYGGIQWGTSTWYLSGPYAPFSTNSISYPNGAPRSATFDFVAPSVLTSLEAGNGGTTSSTVTVSCAGNAVVSLAIAPHTRATIQTGWTAACTTIALASSNGWDTNFDTIAYR